MHASHSRTEIREHTARLLDALGDDPDQVAGRLGDAGVRGAPGDARGCAVAVYLSAVVASDPGIGHIKVTTGRVTVSRGWRPCVVVRLPRAVRLFITGFDHNAYPDLVRPLPRPAEQSTRV